MNFKDRYQMEENQIHPDPAFLDQLALEMKREQVKVRRRKRMMASTGAVAAAAAVCVIVLHGSGALQSQENGQEIIQKADVVETKNTNHSLDMDKWQDVPTSEDEGFEEFKELLNDSEIETLYCSTEAEWGDDDILTKEEADVLADALKGAEPTEESASGDCLYYMAVFDNGKIVKFEIYDGNYLKLKDAQAVYAF